MKILFWLSLLDLLVNGDPIKRALRLLSKRATSVPVKFAIGAAYGNLSLYGYMGTGSMIYQTVKETLWQEQKSVTPVTKK
jgi:hypothetical protein